MSAPVLPDIETPEDFPALEWKALPSGESSSPLTGVIDHDDEQGTITALVAVSGVGDDVGDVIVPGSLGMAIKRLKPKGVLDHNWANKVSKLVWAAELMPGDPRLPPTTPTGEPWPVNAGGLLVKAKYNLDKQMGRDAYADAKFYGPEECFSIGYKVRPGGSKMRGGRRHLIDYDIYEWSQVLHGAHPLAHLTGVKSLAETVGEDCYGDNRSGVTDEGSALLSDDIEIKAIRVVRDPNFWGLPFGTPIRAGMRPRGRTRAATAQELAATTAPADDVKPGAAPAAPAAPVAPAASDKPAAAPGQAGAKPGQEQAAPDAVAVPPGPGVAPALAALRQRYQDFITKGLPSAAATLSGYANPGADVRASADGALAAVNTGQGWRVVDTANGSFLPHLDPNVPPETVDRVLQELADSGIPWADIAARKKRWADDKRKTADQETVRKILAGATPFGEPTPDPVEARRDAEDAIDAQDRDALADALTRMGLPAEQDPHELAGNLIVIPPETVAKRLDAIAAGAPQATPEQAPAKPEPFKPTGNVNDTYIDKLSDDELEAEHRDALRRYQKAHTSKVPRTSLQYTDARLAAQIYGDAKRKRTVERDKAHTVAVDEAHARDKGTATAKSEPKPQTGSSVVAAYRAGKMNVPDFQAAVAASPQTRPALLAELGVDEVEALLEHSFLSGDTTYRDQVIARLAEIDPARARGPQRAARERDQATVKPKSTVTSGGINPADLKPGSRFELDRPAMARGETITSIIEVLGHHSRKGVDYLATRSSTQGEGAVSYDHFTEGLAKGTVRMLPSASAPDSAPKASSRPPDAVSVPDDLLAQAEAVRADAFGIEEGPDGEITVTEEVAARQDRIVALLGEGDGDDSIAGYSDQELGGTRRDLVAELALQDELRRREAERKREVAVARQARTSTADAGDDATEDTGPKLRPGLAGAAEDLGDLLNATPRDYDAVTAASNRFAKLVRRAPTDSKAFITVQKAIADHDGNVHAAVASGDLKAGMLFAAAAALREERRVRRNELARERRKVRRIDRDRLRSMLGTVDVALRGRGLNPDDYGGAVISEPSGPATSTTAPPAPPPGSEPDPDDPTGQRAARARAAARRAAVRPAAPPDTAEPPAPPAPGAAQSALERRARRALATALRGLGVQDAPGEANRLLALDDEQADAELVKLTATLGTGAAGDSPQDSASTAAPPTSPDSAEQESIATRSRHVGGPTVWDEIRNDAGRGRIAALADASAEDLSEALRLIDREAVAETVGVDASRPGRRRARERAEKAIRAAMGAQSPQESGGGDGRPGDTNAAVLRDTPAAPAREPARSDGILPGAGGPRPGDDPAADGSDSGTRPARRDVPGQTGQADGGAARGDREGDAGVPAGPAERPGRDDGAADAGGSGAGRGDDGVSGSDEPVARPEAFGSASDDASPAQAPSETDAGVTQPAPERSQIEAIPDTGAPFVPTGSADFAPAGKKAKLDANLAALRVLRNLQTQRRPATPDEQAVLARWAGWGGLPEVFDDDKPEYATQRDELRGLLSDSEWNEAKRNTLNAHYTDPSVVSALWTAVRDLGFDGGRVLEPGSGSGTFIGFAAPNADMVGVELDSTTAAISRALYPHATIRNESFADSRFPAGSFDAAIGNVPFGDFALQDRVHNPGRKLSIHNHFIKKSLAATKPGGICAVLTSRYTLDSAGQAARKELAEMGDLIGAVRLPTGSHSKTSGTDVIEDILIFRRREPDAEPLTDQGWVKSSKRTINGQSIHVNDYFTAHPGYVLGEMTAEPGQFGSGSLIVKGDKSMADLPGVLEQITEAARTDGIAATPRMAELDELTEGIDRHEGHIGVDVDGNFTQAVGGAAVALVVPDKQAEELRALIGLRDTLRALLSAESASVSDSPQIRELRAELNTQYDDYVVRFKGPLNRYKLTKTGARNLPPVQHIFRRDPMSAIVRALEVYDPETGTGAKTDIFRKRAVSPRVIPTTAETPEDALALCLDTYGEIRLGAIADMLGTSEGQARERLAGLVFEQPPLTVAESDAAFRAHIQEASGGGPEIEGRFGGMRDQGAAPDVARLDTVGESVRAAGRLEPAAAYLSGNVRRKLAAAREAAKHDERFAANVEALAAVIPTDLGVDEVDGRLGAAWIPAEDVKAFLVDLIHDGKDDYNSIKVSTSGGGIWTVEGAGYGNKAREEWGTDRISAGEIVQALLEQRSITIKDTIDKKQYTNLEATVAAQAKAEEISERFSEWLWEDTERTKRLLANYNNQFNAIRLRSYDGVPRTFPGMSDEFKPFDHQVAAVNRIVEEPCALLAHVVGAGKTAEMAMGAAELKRLGLARKPAIVVPNHMLEQFSREYLQIYPNAKILAAGSDDLTGERRREFVARAATGEWDCVILTQGAMKLIPMSQESMSAYIDRELATMRDQLKRAKDEAGEDSAQATTIKKMEKAIIKAEEAMKAKLDKDRDAGVSFEQTGIDYVFIDEAHQYSNLRTISNIQGAGAVGSDIAQDLHMKIEYLRANNASGRVATFATGTPIRNTVTQAYIMQRFMRPDLLEEAGIFSFDQWAATFGQTVEEMELKPEGTGFRQTTRFAKFRNVPELLRLFHVFADVKMADDLNLKTPDLATGGVQNVVVPASDELREYIKTLGQRADDVRGNAPQMRPAAGGGEDVEDNMLLISTDGRKAALSMEMVGGTHAPGKIEAAADNIAKIWRQTKDRPVPKDINDPAGGDDPPPGGMQIVFLDMGTPSSKGFNAYDKLRKQLVDQGMDANGIRFMHDAKNDREKAELFAAARNGQVQVLIGSTEMMGVGTNVQRRAVALHHLDAPWRPSDVEQRDGRIMRQGNTNKEVAIYRYVTEHSFDAYMWQTLERKKKFIDQIMRGKLGDIREIEDVGDTALSYAEVKALATGNPLLMEKAKADVVVGKLGRLERQHDRIQTNLRRDVPAYRANAAEADANAAKFVAAVAKRTDTTGKNFTVTINGQRIADRGEAVEALKAAMRSARMNYSSYRNEPRLLASFGGHDLYGQIDRYYDRYGTPSYGITLTWDGLPGQIERLLPERMAEPGPGIFTTLRNSLDGFESREAILRDRAESYRAEAETMEARIGVAFAHAEALASARAESARLAAAMEASGLTDTGPAETGPSKGLAIARRRTAERATQMGRTQAGPEKETLKRFANPAAAGKSYASADGSIAAMGDGLDLKVFTTADGVNVRPSERRLGTGYSLIPGYVDDPQALVDELAALDLPWDQGQWAFRSRWNPYGADYGREDYSLSYEQRQAARQAKMDAIREQEAADKAAIRAVWDRHLVQDKPEGKSAQAVISEFDLLRAQRLGVSIKAKAKPGEIDDDAETLESYVELVSQDDRYVTDAGGTLQRMTVCAECGGDVMMPVHGDRSMMACTSCGALPAAKRDRRRAPVG